MKKHLLSLKHHLLKLPKAKQAILAGLLLFLFIGCIIYAIQKTEQKKQLTLYGNVDIRYVNLGFRVSGKITQMYFNEGDFVPAQALLAQLDTAPYQAALEKAQGQMQQAKVNFAKFEHGNRPEEIEQARSAVEKQKAALSVAEINLARQVKLLPTGATTQENYDNALASRDEAQAALNNLQEALTLAIKGFRQEDIDAAQAQYESAQANLVLAEINLGDTQLFSPEAGQLLTKVNEPGSVVAEGAPVYVLSLLTPVWVRTYLEEPDLTKVRPGMSASVWADGHKNPFPAQIGYISSQAEFTPKNVETQELRTSLVYRMRLVVDDPHHILRQGMPVTVTINLKT